MPGLYQHPAMPHDLASQYPTTTPAFVSSPWGRLKYPATVRPPQMESSKIQTVSTTDTDDTTNNNVEGSLLLFTFLSRVPSLFQCENVEIIQQTLGIANLPYSKLSTL